MPRSFAGMTVTIGNDIYIIGGIIPFDVIGGGLGVTSLVDVYHTDTDTWETLSPMIATLTADGGSTYEEEIGVAFGTASHVEIFDGSDIKNYIYIVGGAQQISVNVALNKFNIIKYNQRILRYCVEDNLWEYSNILMTNELSTYQRISPLSLVYDNKLIVFDGAIETNNQFIYPSEDFYINILEDFQTPSSGLWINFGSGYMGEFPVSKYQSAMIKYNTDPSGVDSFVTYYILGGANETALSLDVFEKMITNPSEFIYESSYDKLVHPSATQTLTGLPVAKHGASAEYISIDGVDYIYLMGGYTINRPESFVEISFDV